MKAPKFITSHAAFRTLHSESGFTLVEIAMVLVLLGVLVTFGMTLVGPLTKKLKYNATKEIIQADIDGIEGWSYDGKLLPTSGTWATVVRNPNDAWTKSLVYIYDTNLTTASLCGRSTTSYTLLNCGGDAACAAPTSITNVAFFVISGGENFNIQSGSVTNAQVSTCTAGQTCVPIYNYGTANVTDYYTADMNRTENYDDIVYYVTLNELRTKAGCKGAQLQILNQELPAGINSQAYSANIYVDPAYAGVTPYAWSVSGQTAATFGCGAGNYPPSGNFCCGGTGTCTGTCTGICVSGSCTGGAGTCTGTCVTGGAGVAGQCTYKTGICLNGTTGELSSLGSPIVAEACSLPFTINVTDSNSNSATKAFLLDIK